MINYQKCERRRRANKSACSARSSTRASLVQERKPLSGHLKAYEDKRDTEGSFERRAGRDLFMRRLLRSEQRFL